MIADLLVWVLELLAPHLQYADLEAIADVATEAMTDEEQALYYSERVDKEQVSPDVCEEIYEEMLSANSE